MAQCPGCGTASGRVHSRYRRRLADAAIAGRTLVLLLVVRRFICANTGCEARTFVEQVDGLTRKWSRRTNQLSSMRTTIGLSLAGRAVHGWRVGWGCRPAGTPCCGWSVRCLIRRSAR
ncbi:transposase family protein [Nocardia vinacea]|uniref:transposase family protein n=1 Tax=Nocardia vinacea TaxID=96468 RepID=UPI0033C2DA9E